MNIFADLADNGPSLAYWLQAPTRENGAVWGALMCGLVRFW
jgi:hypothetical protein